MSHSSAYSNLTPIPVTNYAYSNIKPIPVAIAQPVNVRTTTNKDLSVNDQAKIIMMEPLPITYTSTSTTCIENEKHHTNPLIGQGFTSGLFKSIERNNDVFAQRIWIIDNSGSMQTTDGNRIVESIHRNNVKIVPCSRWEEICECISYHIRLASTINAPTSFRLLNDPGVTVGPQRFAVAEIPGMMSVYNNNNDAQEALNIMQMVRPAGCTPLTQHILDIYSEVSALAPQLRQSGKRIAIIIATDGLPTDANGYGGQIQQREFVNSLRKLENLPVWVVIRLCTDEESIVSFYNALDSMMELSVEVLDDFIHEAQEVYTNNPWLNYALPLHRMREMGHHDRIFDLLDERRLTKKELRDVCAMIFGNEKFDDGAAPDPDIDWNQFVKYVERLLQKEKLQWDPIKGRMRPWIDILRLQWCYSDIPILNHLQQIKNTIGVYLCH